MKKTIKEAFKQAREHNLGDEWIQEQIKEIRESQKYLGVLCNLTLMIAFMVVVITILMTIFNCF